MIIIINHKIFRAHRYFVLNSLVNIHIYIFVLKQNEDLLVLTIRRLVLYQMVFSQVFLLSHFENIIFPIFLLFYIQQI